MRFRIALLAAGVGAVALMSGCDVKPVAIPAPSASVEPAPVAAQSAADPEAVVSSEPVAASPSTAAVAAAAAKADVAAATGCPVTAATLLSALRNDPSDFYQAAGSPASLVEAVCYEGYALARTPAGGQRDRVSVVFTFNAATTAWSPINVGSADVCWDVPAEIASHLPGCE